VADATWAVVVVAAFGAVVERVAPEQSFIARVAIERRNQRTRDELPVRGASSKLCGQRKDARPVLVAGFVLGYASALRETTRNTSQ